MMLCQWQENFLFVPVCFVNTEPADIIQRIKCRSSINHTPFHIKLDTFISKTPDIAAQCSLLLTSVSQRGLVAIVPHFEVLSNTSVCLDMAIVSSSNSAFVDDISDLTHTRHWTVWSVDVIAAASDIL